ncbi:MAG: transglycosylase domain-containing protein [Dermatophilaceae bacterium]
MSDPEPETAVRSRRRVWLRRIGLTLGAMFGLVVIAVGVAWATIPVPDANDLADAQTTVISYADGTTEMARIAELNRESVPLAKVPEHVRRAVIAAEDRDFYSNSGISPSGIARSVWQALRGGEVQGGGSTITQQYVKNYFLTQDRTLSRKLKEMVISVKIDKDQSKDQILEGYLNTIYYGRGAYGIQTAAKAYFGKDVSQLTVAEGAVLASVINAPSLYDPALGDKQAASLASRVSYVLDGMVSQGWLTPTDRAAAAMPAIVPKAPSRTLSGPTGYIVAAVRQELKTKLKLSDQDIDRGGLRITTTIDKPAQDAAVAAMDKDFPKTGVDDVYAGLVAVKPGDGAVVAMYGGKDYQTRQFSAATDAKIPAGSTFKPFALIGALQQKVSTKTVVDGDSPLKDPRLGGATVDNEGKRSYGPVDLRRATASSINTAFMRLNLQIGAKATYDGAIAAGIPADTTGLGQEYTNVLGTAAPRILDVADAYATIAAQGRRATPYLIAKAGATALDLDYTVTPNVVDAFGKDVAADVIDAMRQVTASGGTGARAAQVGRPVAGKTGTSEERKSVWFSGYAPQLAASVAMYKDVGGVPQPLTGIGGLDELSGNSFPLSIWIDFMKAALSGKDVVQFPERAGIGDSSVTATRTATPSPSTTATPTATVTVTTPPVTSPPATPTPSPPSTPTPSAPTSGPPTPAPAATRSP